MTPWLMTKRLRPTYQAHRLHSLQQMISMTFSGQPKEQRTFVTCERRRVFGGNPSPLQLIHARLFDEWNRTLFTASSPLTGRAIIFLKLKFNSLPICFNPLWLLIRYTCYLVQMRNVESVSFIRFRYEESHKTT